jgi:hypothetical protein
MNMELVINKLTILINSRELARHDLAIATRKYKEKVNEFNALDKNEWKDLYNCTNAEQRKAVIFKKTTLLKENMDLIDQQFKYFDDVYNIALIPDIGGYVLVDIDSKKLVYNKEKLVGTVSDILKK